MSETKKTTKSKKITPAALQDGDPVISKDLADKYNDYVKNIKLTVAEEAPNGAISAPNKPGPGGKKKSSSGTSESGAITSAGANRKTKLAPATSKSNTEEVALHSTRNVSWLGVGKLSKGYNIVSKESSEKWLTRDHVRLAAPEEVASEYSN